LNRYSPEIAKAVREGTEKSPEIEEKRKALPAACAAAFSNGRVAI
jgi:hypothetical protein